MGTRNITRVISNNQLKVCQYCQWDGYPTGAGRSIIDFIRNTDDDHMVERLEHVTLNKVTEEGARIFATGAPFTDEIEAISNSEWDLRQVALMEVKRIEEERRRKTGERDYFMTASEQYEYIEQRVRELLTKHYGETAVRNWLIAIRDTGCKILNIVYESDSDLNVWTEDYLQDNFGDWQIEGVWQLDYDQRMLTGWWHGLERSWSFEILRSLDNEMLDGLMKEYENAGWED